MDMLVNLLNLPDVRKDEKKIFDEFSIAVRRPVTPDLYRVLEYVEKESGLSAKGEAAVAFSHRPVSMYIATLYDEIVGYACYDATFPSFFGPTEVREDYRGKGVGKILLVKALEGLRDIGYVYGFIGDVGPVDFYRKCVGAIEIPGSTPAGYKDMLSYNKSG